MKITTIIFIAVSLISVLEPSLTQRRHQQRNAGVGKGERGSGVLKKPQEHKITPSVSGIIPVDTKGRFSITSMTVQHRGDSRWYVPHFHDRYSPGWNRTFIAGFMNHPVVCNIRFFAVGLEKTLEHHKKGGTGYLTLEFKRGAKPLYYGFDKNETGKLHCYYMTNKGFGSEFIDTPKTLSMVIYCPVPIDNEVGFYHHRAAMEQGYFCRTLADVEATVTIHLRPSDFPVPLDYAQHFYSTEREINSEVKTEPTANRIQRVTDPYSSSGSSIISSNAGSSSGGPGEDQVGFHAGHGQHNGGHSYAAAHSSAHSSSGSGHRPHAVCTVQTFRNSQTGPMLYLFVSYYHRLGWRVIVYDRFGFHREFIEDLLGLPGFDYYEYTLFQLVNPSKYNAEYAKKQGFGYKIYYNMEKNWGYAAKTNGTLTDTADQDADKARTYDHSRIEYAHLDSIAYVDSDELLYCPQAGQGLRAQRRFQQRLMSTFVAQGIEEMRMVRLPYSGLAPASFNSSSRKEIENNDFTLSTADCMQSAYMNRSVAAMLGCWSNASSYDDFPKSADLAGVCPFHYNHWSCDGMRGGGRDRVEGPRCRCKVGFDLINGYAYRPIVDKCHLLHFNNNKYRFQYRRIEFNRDELERKAIKRGHQPPPREPKMHHGDATKRCPMYQMFAHASGSGSASGTISSSTSSSSNIAGSSGSVSAGAGTGAATSASVAA